MALPLTGQNWNAMSPDEKAFFKAMGRRVAQRRQELGLTQVQMGEILDIPQATFGAYEVGRHGFPIALLPALARALRMDVGALLGETEKMPAKRGPVSVFEHYLEQVGKLPKSKQLTILDMIKGVLAQHSR